MAQSVLSVLPLVMIHADDGLPLSLNEKHLAVACLCRWCCRFRDAVAAFVGIAVCHLTCARHCFVLEVCPKILSLWVFVNYML